MLNNLTNFLNIIKGKMIKTKPDASDLIVLGTKNANYGGGYAPSAILYSDIKADILGELPEEGKCGIHFGLNFASVGPKVSFKRPNFSSNITDIIIPGLVEFKRDNNVGGIYNAQDEVSWNSNQSPLFTEWNSVYTDDFNNGWGNLFNASNRTYDTFRNSLNGMIGAIIVGQKLLFRHTSTGRMWIIEFTEWTQAGNGGGFAYDRYEIFPATNFYRPTDSPYTVDHISEGLIIKRDNIKGIYNAVLETSYDSNWYISPKGTEWNSSYTDNTNFGFSDLSNLRTRKYGTWRDAVDANPPAAVSDELELIMHDLSTDLYWKIVFTDWGIGDNGDKGTLGYTRTLIPQDCGVKFNDGTVMTTAPISSGPVIDAEGNLIVANSSNDLVEVGPGASHLIPNFSGMLIVNDHYDGGVETWIAGGGDTVCLGATNTGGGPVGSTLAISGSGYEWTNVSNMNGPFTFTVVKTRNEA